MVGAVDQLDVDVHDRVAGEHAALERLPDALVHGGMYSRGIAPPTILLSKR